MQPLIFYLKNQAVHDFILHIQLAQKQIKKKIISEIEDVNYILIGGKTDNWSLPFEKEISIII